MLRVRWLVLRLWHEGLDTRVRGYDDFQGAVYPSARHSRESGNPDSRTRIDTSQPGPFRRLALFYPYFDITTGRGFDNHD